MKSTALKNNKGVNGNMNFKGLLSLLHPLSEQKYFDEIYEKNWKHFEEISDGYEELFQSKNLEEYLFKGRPWLVDSEWTEAGMLFARYPEGGKKPPIKSMEEALELYADGHTILLPQAQKRWPPIAKFCAKLSADLFCRIGANVYVTPPNSQAFRPHYDMHDVFLLQTEGSKEWHINNIAEVPLTLTADALREEYYEIDPVKDTVNSEKIVLRKGERLYLPRGTIHSGRSVDDEHSVHITFNILPITWRDLLNAALLHEAVDNIKLRKTIPFDILEDLTTPNSKKKIEEMSQELLKDIDLESLWRFIYTRTNSLLPSENGIESIHNASKINENTNLKIREGSEIFVHEYKDRAWASFTGRKIDIPTRTIPYFHFLMDNCLFKVAELPDHLPGESKVIFSKWLVRKGLAIIS